MLKFWKKKPAPGETAAEEAPAQPSPDARAGEAAPVAAEAGEADDAPLEATGEEPGAGEDQDPRQGKAAAGGEPVQAAAEAPGAQRLSWRERLSGSGLARGLSSLFVRHPRLDDAFLDELETCLVTADVGFATASELVEDLRTRVERRQFADSGALLRALRAELVARLAPVQQPLDITVHKPFVVLVVGVNGVGKTTTIGKIARRYRDAGHSVLLAAGDTFRAAAVEQLQEWGARNQVAVISQGSGADSASVVFDALQAARSRGSDLLVADTAGRLHTQSGLMDELAKIRRVLARLDPGAPHEVLLVLDGTTGQNAISQVRQFRDAIGVTGLVVTKLDGTAKGGVVFALAREFGLPIRFVGLGEAATDLRVFDAGAFVDGLLPASLGG
jgi:fused signal recognition particle receptor